MSTKSIKKGRPRKQKKEHITLNIRSDVLKWARTNIDNISKFLEDRVIARQSLVRALEGLVMRQISREEKEVSNRNEPR